MICNDRQLGICKCKENWNSWCSRYNQFTFCCSHKNLFPSFTYNIIEKLDENSYLIWLQQVEPFLSRNFPLIHLRIQSCARYRESYVQYLGITRQTFSGLASSFSNLQHSSQSVWLPSFLATMGKDSPSLPIQN